MNCNVCGRQAKNEQANFCDYCGSSFREQKQNSINMPPQNQGIPYPNGPMNANNMGPMQGYGIPARPLVEQSEKPTSFLNWLGVYGLMLIPVVGWLILLVLLFVWSFDSSTPVSKKNWARATLIFATIAIVLFVAYIITVINSPIYQEIYNSYYNEMMNNIQ